MKTIERIIEDKCLPGGDVSASLKCEALGTIGTPIEGRRSICRVERKMCQEIRTNGRCPRPKS